MRVIGRDYIQQYAAQQDYGAVQVFRDQELMRVETLFDELGGKPTMDRVHVIFYDKLLAHPWLRGFFVGVRKFHLEGQQTDFMTGLLGGPKIYGGRAPKSAHVHLFVTEEVFMLRHKILEDSLMEAEIPADLKERWLRYDMKMKRALVKESVSECEGRYRSEPVIDVPKPQYTPSRVHR
jgi:truncated hemoglobin YjbI